MNVPLDLATLNIVRGGTEADVARLLAIGGRIERQASAPTPYAIVRVGRRRVLAVMQPAADGP